MPIRVDWLDEAKNIVLVKYDVKPTGNEIDFVYGELMNQFAISVPYPIGVIEDCQQIIDHHQSVYRWSGGIGLASPNTKSANRIAIKIKIQKTSGDTSTSDNVNKSAKRLFAKVFDQANISYVHADMNVTIDEAKQIILDHLAKLGDAQA